jgi:hypothetical protein
MQEGDCGEFSGGSEGVGPEWEGGIGGVNVELAIETTSKEDLIEGSAAEVEPQVLRLRLARKRQTSLRMTSG